jgi:hypothetical protein
MAKYLEPFDEGRFSQIVDLGANGGLIHSWASLKMLEGIVPRIETIKQGWKRRFGFKIPLLIFCGIFIVSFLIPAHIINSSKEITQGVFYPRTTAWKKPADTLRVDYGSIYNVPEFGDELSSTANVVDKEITITADIEFSWYYKGRYLFSQWVIVDSIPKVVSYSALIHPPGYLKINPYSTSDTLFLYEGSSIDFQASGLLLNLVALNVSRETLDRSISFTWKEGQDLELNSRKWIDPIQLPVVVLKDKYPSIVVQQNNLDSVVFICEDDFGLRGIYINDNKVVTSSSNKELIKIFWNQGLTEIEVVCSDSHQQVSKSTIKRPTYTSTSRLELAKVQGESKLGIQRSEEDVESKLKDGKREQSREKQIEKKKQDTKPKDRNHLEETKKDKWEAALEELLKKEQLLSLLEEVSKEEDASLDSAIVVLMKDLDKDLDKQEKEALEEIKQLPKSGEDRKDKASEAAKKLRELLNEEVVSVNEENIERIKRLLKTSWSASEMQEDVSGLTLDVRRIKYQRSVVRIERLVEDSLSMLLVHEPDLGIALMDSKNRLSKELSEIEYQLGLGQDVRSQSGYLLEALNELDKVLYLILESEKKSLNQSKKECKNGKPGKTGKPSAKGMGQPGEKGEPKSGKKPGGRQKGTTGNPQPAGGEGSTSPGEGKGSSLELLKRLEDALLEMGTSGAVKERKELEDLKRDLLFNSESDRQRLEAIEERLWQVEQSIYNKKDQGNSRESKEGSTPPPGVIAPIEIEKVKSGTTDVPLPVLKSSGK